MFIRTNTNPKNRTSKSALTWITIFTQPLIIGVIDELGADRYSGESGLEINTR